jgi:hypothetical protein
VGIVVIDYTIQPIPNFSLAEMQCKCGCGLIIIQRDMLMCTYEVRLEMGIPIIVKSWTRCKAHNKVVGGKWNSYHRYGKAGDFVPEGGMTDRFEAVCRAKFPYVERHAWGCHCDIRGRRGL